MLKAPDQLPALRDTSVLDVTVSISNGGSVLIRVAGEVDALSAPVLQRAVDAAWAAGSRRIVVDLRAVTFLNVPGLRALHCARGIAAERGAVLELNTCPGHVARLLQLVGLDSRPGEPAGPASCPHASVPHRRPAIERFVPAPRH